MPWELPVAASPSLRQVAQEMNARFGSLDAASRLREAAALFPGRIAAVSSFGTQSAVLLHLVAGVDPRIPVIFLDTGKLFVETLRHRDALVRDLGLLDVRSVRPDASELADRDPDGILWARDAEACCALRKAAPQARALEGFAMIVTGRKRYQTAERRRLPWVESASDGRLRLNPIADWDASTIEAYRVVNELPAHPLAEQGYPSVGCRHCTDRVAPGEDQRAGRWRGQAKTECGMHPRSLGEVTGTSVVRHVVRR
ncbi:phosphoadenylyl-sulfate reductase [Falsiroseomonas sp. HW251]|uniref:phosphoadenylyl-sulfate reductase n=1 Tax=Falsiroseomonas sp. HW251 TaxID=3390998 RepID=UPI003D320EFC